MSCFLSLECSSVEGSLALAESDEKSFRILVSKTWIHQVKKAGGTHSDKLPGEINSLLKKGGKSLSDLEFLAVGTGPGRWTGIRTALGVIRSLSFALKIPVFSLSSLRICAEPFLNSSQPVLLAFNGFKNQVYSAKFQSKEDLAGEIHLWSFEKWCEYMEASPLKNSQTLCLSDLEDFYSIPENLKASFSFQKAYPNAKSLAQLAFRERKKQGLKDGMEIKAFYLRDPLQ